MVAPAPARPLGDEPVTPAAGDLFATPDRYFYAFEGDEALFLPVDRDVYRRSLFLDDRIALDSGEIMGMPVQALAEWRERARLPLSRIGWIFHVAHCGSTLLARALDHEERTLVLREPLPLRQLGVAGATLPPERSAPWTARLRLAVALVGRRYRPEAPVIVKANVPVNFILPDLLALDPTASGIVLHLPLAPYLLAILRSDAHRDWVVRVTDELAPAIARWSGAMAGLDVVERAAALWLSQMRLYAAMLDRCSGLRSLDAATLFAQPRAVLAAAFALFDVAMPPAEIDAIVDGPLFATHAKRPDERFDDAARRAREAALADRLAGDVERARRWVEHRGGTFPIPERLSHPLVGSGTALLA